jgi:lysozyme family protein
MTDQFSVCLPFSLAWEGGYVNNPKDPGGATMRGVTQRTYDGYRHVRGLPTQPVVKIATSELEAIYRHDFWNLISGDRLPSGINLAMLDFAINSGPSRAVRYMQSAVGLTGDDVDGDMGNITLSRILGVNDREGLLDDYMDARIAFMRSSRNRETGALLWPTFGKGWTNRVNSIKATALRLMGR